MEKQQPIIQRKDGGCMTWEELKEEAKKMGYTKRYDLYGDYMEPIDGMKKDMLKEHRRGVLTYMVTFDEFGNMDLHGLTNDQILAIMKALQ